MNKNGMPEIAQKIVTELRSNYSSFYDAGGSIGRRYRRQDEAGTPFGVTIDHDTLDDNTVTLRDRDTMNQIRISADKLSDAISDKIKEL
jgi:glycyl-tRNA synthetase